MTPEERLLRYRERIDEADGCSFAELDALVTIQILRDIIGQLAALRADIAQLRADIPGLLPTAEDVASNILGINKHG